MNLKNEIKLEALRAVTLREVHKSISAMMDEVKLEFRKQIVQMQEFSKSSNYSVMNNPSEDYLKINASVQYTKISEDALGLTDSSKHKIIRRERIFVTRESLLTNMLQIDHFRTVRNLFYIIYFIIVANALHYEYFGEGRYDQSHNNNLSI